MTINPWVDQLEDPVVSDDIDSFLASVTTEKLSGRDLPFDLRSYIADVKVHAVRAKHKELTDAGIQWMSKWLMRPLYVVKQTIKCTSRRLKACFSYPMKKHYQARFPWISESILRLNKIVSTDIIFSSKIDSKVNSVPKSSMGLRPMSLTFMP